MTLEAKVLTGIRCLIDLFVVLHSMSALERYDYDVQAKDERNDKADES